MREVIEGRLWLGNAGTVRDVSLVLRAGVSAIVELAIEEPPTLYPRDVIVCRFPLLDGSGNSHAILLIAIRTLAMLIQSGTPTLVACSGGMSRSPAILSAALSLVMREKLDETLKRVIDSGPCDVSPALWNDIRHVIANEM